MQGRKQVLLDVDEIVIPEVLAVETSRSGLQLLDHQRKGVRWLLEAWSQARNVMLADEMGLGKTIQAIAFIKELMVTFGITRPFLVSVPLSTIENWRREFQIWCPEARVVTYLGRASSSSLVRTLDFYHTLKTGTGVDLTIPSFNVLLTSFDYLRSDFNVFAAIEWQSFIIDEGQKMKNNNSAFFRKCRAIHAQFKILLSGTPL